MADMFTSFNNLPNNYIPNNKQKFLPNRDIYVSPLEVYNIKNELIGYKWNYGDSIVLNFVVSGTVEDDSSKAYMEADQYLIDKNVELNIFDFKHDLIYTKVQPAEVENRFLIDSTLSRDKFLRGAYSCELNILSKPIEPTDKGEKIVTIFDGHNGTISVI